MERGRNAASTIGDARRRRDGGIAACSRARVAFERVAFEHVAFEHVASCDEPRPPRPRLPRRQARRAWQDRARLAREGRIPPNTSVPGHGEDLRCLPWLGSRSHSGAQARRRGQPVEHAVADALGGEGEGSVGVNLRAWRAPRRSSPSSACRPGYLRRYVTYCARRRRFAQMEGAARLYREVATAQNRIRGAQLRRPTSS
jgi:hypothetical protein